MVKWKPTTMSVQHMSYITFCLVEFFLLEPACKKILPTIADKITDIQPTKSTAEQPHNPTVPTQPLEADIPHHRVSLQ